MKLNIHVSFCYSSGGLKEDEMTKYPIGKMKLLPFKAYLFFSSHIFSQGFIVWFGWFF